MRLPSGAEEQVEQASVEQALQMAMAAGSGNAAAVEEAVRQSEQMRQAGISEAMTEAADEVSNTHLIPTSPSESLPHPHLILSQEAEVTFGGGAGSLMDDFAAEAAEYRKEAEAAQVVRDRLLVVHMHDAPALDWSASDRLLVSAGGGSVARAAGERRGEALRP